MSKTETAAAVQHPKLKNRADGEKGGVGSEPVTQTHH